MAYWRWDDADNSQNVLIMLCSNCIYYGTPLKEIHQKVWGYIASHHHEQGPFIAAPGVALALFSAYPCE
ncbi:MAG: hypothetical protein H6860_05205 [Rhodospirillales bacterium]|nr:hypothetical protein [Rhodospirillales bacterium]